MLKKLKKVFKIWIYVYTILSFLDLSTQNIVTTMENNMDIEDRIDDGRDKVYMTSMLTLTMMNVRKIYLYVKRGLA